MFARLFVQCVSLLNYMHITALTVPVKPGKCFGLFYRLPGTDFWSKFNFTDTFSHSLNSKQNKTNKQTRKPMEGKYVDGVGIPNKLTFLL